VWGRAWRDHWHMKYYFGDSIQLAVLDENGMPLLRMRGRWHHSGGKLSAVRGT
jgi:hypothetical protein